MDNVTSGIDALTGQFSVIGTGGDYVGRIGAGLKLAAMSAVDATGVFLLRFWIEYGFKVFLIIVVWEIFKWAIPHVMTWVRGRHKTRREYRKVARNAIREHKSARKRVR